MIIETEGVYTWADNFAFFLQDRGLMILLACGFVMIIVTVLGAVWYGSVVERG